MQKATVAMRFDTIRLPISTAKQQERALPSKCRHFDQNHHALLRLQISLAVLLSVALRLCLDLNY